MSGKEGGVPSGAGRYLFQGGEPPSFLSDFPPLFTLEGCPLPWHARGGGRGWGAAPVISRPHGPLYTSPFLFFFFILELCFLILVQ